MANCPVCQSPVNEKANFCAECGNQLSTATFDREWIVAMQLKIKNARQNDVTYNVTSMIGVILAMAIPFAMRYILHYTMDTLSWLLTAVGAALFIGGMIGLWVDNRRVKKFIAELEQGVGKEKPQAPAAK